MDNLLELKSAGQAERASGANFDSSRISNKRNDSNTIRSSSDNANGNNGKKDGANRDQPSTTKAPPLPKQPLVARISLWTTRTNGKLTKIGSHDSGHDSDKSDDDDDDQYERRAHDAGDDLELDENAQLEQRLKQANLPDHVRKVTTRELQKLRRTPTFMSDYVVTRSYLELIADLPWNEQSAEVIDLRKSRRDLDNDHYGLQRPKERVLQYLAVRKLKAGASTGAHCSQPILVFVGPPGTGKTSIAQSIANSLGRKFYRISLGGIADQSAIRGHRRTYIGSMPGRIIQGIKQVGVNNPVFLLDELDKMTPGPQGDPSGALLEVLDPEQNHTFTDHYLNMAFDLSRVLFIGTANSLENIPAALLDRMEVIQLSGYTHDEKFNIARRHLVPKQVRANGLSPGLVVFKDEALHKVIGSYAREAGVRTLERRLASICRQVAVRMVEDEQQQHRLQPNEKLSLPVVVDAASLETYLGPAVYERESSTRVSMPGVAIGLAWTASGGEITFVEAQIMKGNKRENLVLTGQLGSVMRESAQLALNWLRANFHRFDQLPASLGRDLVDNTVHVHFPAGAVGKDGPSAGVTIVTALVSLCSGLSLPTDLAMTGEVTLRGLVLKVGGVKSKVLAAHRAGIKRIILPAKNESDLAEVPSQVREKLTFHFVSTLDELLLLAFDGRLALRSAASLAAANLPSDPSSGLTSKL